MTPFPTILSRRASRLALMACAGGLACSSPDAPPAASAPRSPASSPAAPSPAVGSPTLAIVSGSGQLVEVGTVASASLVVEARAAAGGPVEGLAVTLSANRPGTRFLPAATQATDALGRVSFSLEAPTRPSALEVKATTPGASAVTANIDVHAGPAASLKVRLVPAAVRPGDTATIQVLGLDRFSNLTPVSGLQLRISGQGAAVVGPSRLAGLTPGEGRVIAEAGALSDSSVFVVFGPLWRRALATRPIKLRARANGDLVLVTLADLEIRDGQGALKLSVPLPAPAADLALDDAGGRAFISLLGQGLVDNVLVVDLASGAVQSLATGLNQTAYLTYEPITGTLVAVDNVDTVCLMPMTTHQCDLRAAGELPVSAAVDPYAAVALVSNHNSWNASLLYLDGRTVTVPTGMTPFGVAVDPRLHIGVVANAMDHGVTLVDLAAGKALGEVVTGSWPFGAVVDANKSLAVVGHAFGAVAWLDLASRTVVGRLVLPYDLQSVTGGLSQRTVFLTPAVPDLLLLVSFDRATQLPELRPQGQVIEAAAIPGRPEVAIATASPAGLELHRLPIPAVTGS